MRIRNSIDKLLVAIAFIGLILPAPAGAIDITSFAFGNNIDTHQSTRLVVRNGVPVRVAGEFLIYFTGEIDGASGLPIARHPSGSQECGVNVDCVTGWVINAVPGEAKFLYRTGVNGEDHPVWLVNRSQIPQPGGNTHFHWITSQSDDPRFSAVPDPCNVQSSGELENNAENVTCPGWFMQITAVRSFAFDHGGEIVPVERGRDNATHLNLVTNYKQVSGITSTR